MRNAAEQGAPEQRGSRRTNLLLTAAIEWAGLAAPVRIRNVSETGALLEGTHLPAEGERLWLKRANLQIAATVAWSLGSRVGVKFDAALPVESWGGGKPRPIELSGLRDQRRVDAIQEAVRAGRSTASYESASPIGSGTPEQLYARIGEELHYVSRLVENLGDELAADSTIMLRHSKSLQNIDLANQILTHLATVVAAEDPWERVSTIGMSDLRSRLTRQSLPQSLF